MSIPTRVSRFLRRWVVVGALIYQAALLTAIYTRAADRERPPIGETPSPVDPPQTQDLARLFDCRREGGQVSVSLGGDGSSIFLACE